MGDLRREVVPSTTARTHPEYPLDAGPYRSENHPARDNRQAWFLAVNDATRGRSIAVSWLIDPYHLQVEFATKHFGMMTVRGHFTEVSATGSIDPDNPAASSVAVTIPAASIRTNNAMHDDLRSANFLDVEPRGRSTGGNSA